MKLRYKFNLLALGVLFAVGIAISMAGVFTIERLAYNMNHKLTEAEVAKVLEDIHGAHQVLVESGVSSVDSYVRRAQSDILDKYRDYRFGRSGRLQIFGEPGTAQRLTQMAGNRHVDDVCLQKIVRDRRGFLVCSHGDQKKLMFFAAAPEWHWFVLLAVDYSEMLAERNAFLAQVALILFFALIGGLLIFAWFARSIAAPVQQLSEAALALSRGDWQKPLPRSTAVDEVGDLTRAFSQMQDNLSAAQRDLERQAKAVRHTNERLQREIVEHLKTQKEIHKLNQELEQRVLERTAQLKAANDELEAFSYSVSHDLRAPLRSIDGFSKALLDDYGEALGCDGRQFLQRVRRASQRMAQLIDDLLKLSRITRGEMIRNPVNLSQLAKEVFKGLQQAEPAREIVADIQEEVMADGDARLLRVVMDNLLGNAWKFTCHQEKAVIAFGTLEADTAPDGIEAKGPVFFVRDNGAGFDPAYVDKLFGVFQRLHHESEYPGTGVGLATVKRIIQRHGGSIWADGSPGRGACFYFTL